MEFKKCLFYGEVLAEGLVVLAKIAGLPMIGTRHTLGENLVDFGLVAPVAGVVFGLCIYWATKSKEPSKKSPIKVFRTPNDPKHLV